MARPDVGGAYVARTALAGRTHSRMPAKNACSDIAATRCHVHANRLLRLAALWDRQCGVGLARTEQAPPRTVSCCLYVVESKFCCQQTESQNMGMTSNSFVGFRCGGHSHVLVLSLLAKHPPWPRAPTRRRSRAGRVGACAQWGCFPFVLFCRPVLDTRGSLPGARISVQTYNVDPTVLLTSAA